MRPRTPFVLAMLVVAVALILSGTADAKKPKVDSAKGKGVDSIGLPFKFNAKSSGSGGTAATGSFSFRDKSGFHYKGPVTCLREGGSSAVLTGPIDKTNNPDFAGGVGSFLAAVDDSGLPKGAGDQASFTLSAPEELDCASSPIGNKKPLTKGNITVINMP